ncbi:EpsG family protein [Empedobacter sp.]|uniref:EpsG family protein n=1 Tax=Empedobacter sp. TaxID=1927715 RepID=UPI0028A95243|nr:EpsG family protein [Empedobacter sp.]
MIEYFILFLIVTFSIIIFDLNKYKELKTQIYYFIFIFSSLLMGLRYKVGIDTYNYMVSFKNVPYFYNIHFSEILNYEYPPLFLIISSLIKTFISNEFYVFQLFHTFFINYVIFFFIKKNIKFPFIGIFVYFLIYFLYFNTEIIKESIAVCIFLLNYKNLVNRKWLRYYILVIISILFHPSASILLLLPLLINLRFNKKFIIIFSIAILLMLNLSIILPHFSFFEKIRKVQFYLEQDEINNMNFTWNLLLTIQLSVFPFLTLFFLKRIYKLETKFENILLVMVIIGSGCLLNGVIFQRFTNYFIPFYGILLANLFYTYIFKYNKFKILVSFFLVSMCTIYNYDFWSHSRYKIWIPYHSIFNEKEDSDRNELYNGLFKKY